VRGASPAAAVLALAALPTLGGCGGDDGGDKVPTDPAAHSGTTFTPTPTTTTPTPDPCRDPLGVAPLSDGVAPLSGTRFVATGGSGDVVFSFVDNQSGGRLAPLSGEYLAGPITGVDTVRADDAACGSSATAEVEVLGALRALPLTAAVPPGSSFTIEVTGGSGTHRCEAVTLFAGSLSGCTWTAGTTQGTDVLRVVDEGTGEFVEVAYTVDDDADVALWGGRLYVPTDVALAPTLRGGSGVYDLVPSDPSVVVAGGALTATAPGRYTVDATDHFVPSLSTSFALDAVEPVTAPPERDGERMTWGTFAVADLDGDGDDELVFGTPDLSLAAHDSGGVFVWDPSAGPAPVWSWALPQQFVATGRGLAVGDVDGDSFPDLVVGSDGWDENFVGDYGRVDVFYNDGAGGFPAVPDVTLRGDAGDRLGHAVAVCDVDGDGVSDVVAAALQDEDPASGVSNQGSVAVWLGTTFGVDRVATGKVHGATPVGGVLLPDADALMGRRLAAGDVDGDGRCDVVATSYLVNLDGAGSDGVSWLFGADALLGSGPPDRLWSWDGADDSVQSGRNVAVGDLDGDGLDDVVLAGHNADRAGISRGAAFVFLAADDDGRPAEEVVWLDDASVVVEGDEDYDNFAIGVAVRDATGDGAPDLLVGAIADELDGGTYSVGTARVFEAATLLAGPSLTTSDASTFAAPGVDVNDTFGAELTALDADGDGDPELAVYASRADGEGIEAGGVWLVELDGSATRLELPGQPSGQHLGDRATLAWADVDGDGSRDVVGGAWGAPRGVDGFDAGLVFGWAGAADSPTTTLGGVSNHSAGDRLGLAVAVGDFDGDGRDDVVATMPSESRPSSFGAEFANPTECAGSVSGTGAAWFFPGEAAGIGATPMFVFYGLTAGDRLEVVASGFDHDGDGLDDVVFGTTADGPNSEGGVTFVHGRSRPGGGVTVVCAADEHLLGVTSSSRLGVAVAGVGDLDGDGCDEVAAGADLDDLGVTNQGSVRILWGHGAGCASGAAEVTTLAPGVGSVRVGTGVDGGLDGDGDGVPDVVVGGYDFEQPAGTDVGAAWLLSGAWLTTLPRDPATAGLPADGATTVTLLPADRRVVGDQRDAELGAEVALVEAPGGGAWLATGWRFASLGGVQNGGVALWEWGGADFGSGPVGLILGEPGSQTGDALRRAPGRPVLAVGAPLADAAALDAGAILPVTLRR
jgi:hypothetical protein